MAEELNHGTPTTQEPAPSQNFIHEFITEDIAPWWTFCRDAGTHPFSTRTKWLFAHWSL